MDINTTSEDRAVETVAVGTIRSGNRPERGGATASVRARAELDPDDVRELMLELEQRFRIASLRIAIEGEEATADVLETLAGLATLINERLH